MNNQRRLKPRLRALERSQDHMETLMEQLRRYHPLITSNYMQYIASPPSGFTANISAHPRIPPPNSTNTPCVSISSEIIPIAIIHPKNLSLNNSSSARFSAENLSRAKPKTPTSTARKKPCHKIGGAAMSSENSGGTSAGPSEKTDGEEVIYLYSVDSSPGGTIVEEIDLDIESEATSNTAIQPTVANRKASRKRKAADTSQHSSKRVRKDYEPKCSSCGVKYNELAHESENLYITRCGHVLCHPCVEVNRKSCNVCGKEVTSYRKIYL